jgi:hypothetical protein
LGRTNCSHCRTAGWWPFRAPTLAGAPPAWARRASTRAPGRFPEASPRPIA